MAPSDHAHRPLRSGHTLRRGAVLAAAASLCLGTLGALPTSAAPADQDGTAPQQSVTQSKGKIAAPVDPAKDANDQFIVCLLYTSPSPRDATLSRMPSSA